MNPIDGLQDWRYLSAFIGIFLEEAGVPLPFPGDVFIAALGAAGSQGRANFLGATIVVVTAAVSGSAVLYEVARRIGHPFLRRVGRRIGFDEARVTRTEQWLNDRSAITIALWRLVPGFRIVLTVAVGALRLDRTKFLLGVAFASVLWSSIYYWLGYFLGAGVATALQGWMGQVLRDVGATSEIAIVVVLAVLATIAMVVWRRRRRPRSATSGDDTTDAEASGRASGEAGGHASGGSNGGADGNEPVDADRRDVP